MLEALEEGLVRLDFIPTKLGESTTKKIYAGRKEDILSLPKVEQDFPRIDFQELVYPRLNNPVLEPSPRDKLYCLVHGLYRKRPAFSGRIGPQTPSAQYLSASKLSRIGYTSSVHVQKFMKLGSG